MIEDKIIFGARIPIAIGLAEPRAPRTFTSHGGKVMLETTPGKHWVTHFGKHREAHFGKHREIHFVKRRTKHFGKRVGSTF